MVAKGIQGHNKGDKETGGRFKTVAKTVPKPPISRTPRAPKETSKVNKNNSIDYSLWNPPKDMENIQKLFYVKIQGSMSNGFTMNHYERELAKAILPDLSEATDDEMLILRKRLIQLGQIEGTYLFSQLEDIVRQEVDMRSLNELRNAGVADLKEAVDSVEEHLRNQGKTYSAQELLRMRLDQVQEELADPTETYITAKAPSGSEVTLTKPEARAILISMNIRPAEVKPYIPVWPKKN